MASISWPSMPYFCKTLQSLSRGVRSCAFSKSTKHAKRPMPYSQDFSKICFRVKIWPGVLRPERKSHYLSSSLDSIISRHFSFQDIYCSIHFSWQTKQWYFSVVCALLSITFLKYWDNNARLPFFWCFAKLLRNATHSS